MKFVEVILKKNMEKIKLQVCVKYSITNILKKNSKGKIKKKKDESSAPVLYVKLIYSEETKKNINNIQNKRK